MKIDLNRISNIWKFPRTRSLTKHSSIKSKNPRPKTYKKPKPSLKEILTTRVCSSYLKQTPTL